jgi:hypothetical protein
MPVRPSVQVLIRTTRITKRIRIRSISFYLSTSKKVACLIVLPIPIITTSDGSLERRIGNMVTVRRDPIILIYTSAYVQILDIRASRLQAIYRPISVVRIMGNPGPYKT